MGNRKNDQNNSKFKIQNLSGYKPTPQSKIWWSSLFGEIKLPLIVEILNFEFIILNWSEAT
jgi:hypothetical protein